MTVEQVAARTRIPQRHLRTIETGRISDLPGRSYAVGFARTYAKTVGLDPEEIVAVVRAELDEQTRVGDHRPAPFEPGDPARIPSSRLAWLTSLAVVLLLSGAYFTYRALFAPAGELPSLVAEQDARDAAMRKAAQHQEQRPAAPIDPAGQVVFTSLADQVWVKFYDAAGRTLMQKQMARGETFAIPADAQGPQVWTGRPDAFQITVGGRVVPKLDQVQRTIRDVPISAAALLARTAAPAPAASPSANAVPVAGSVPQRRAARRPAAPTAQVPDTVTPAEPTSAPEPSPTA